VLWDLVDDPLNPVPHPYKKGITSTFPHSDPTEAFDTISGMEALIFSIFDNALDNWWGDAPDLCEFVDEGWFCELTGAQRDAIIPILDHYNVGCERECD
jgi:hypothetical protein